MVKRDEHVTIVPSFKGGDEWVQAQLQKKEAKTSQLLARNSNTDPIVEFNRAKFTEDVKNLLSGDVNDGFVIGLRHRRAFASQLCQQYKFFTEAQKLDLVLALAVDLGLHDLSLMVKTLPSIARTHLVLNVMAAALGYSRKNESNISKSIKRGLVPVPEQFFLLVGSIPQGPKFLLTLRVDLRALIKKYRQGLPKETVEALEYLEMVMKDLFATQAAMRFRRIDMASEATLASVLLNERVHRIRDWNDLQQRVIGPNRFCFGLFHLNMPTAPLAFVEAVVSDHMCDRIAPILNVNDCGISDPKMARGHSLITNYNNNHLANEISRPTHVTFYSISNCNRGISGLNVASHLLFLTIQRMTNMFPEVHTAATLSPVPGFASWLYKALLQPTNIDANFPLITTIQASRLSQQYHVAPSNLSRWLAHRLKQTQWATDSVFIEATMHILKSACARYALFERTGEKMSDPVANFHLQNGAQVEQINFLADDSDDGIASSFGMMINYRYCMTSVDVTSVSYKRTSAAAASASVVRLVWPGSANALSILDEIENLKYIRNIPLYARVYQPGDKLCTRGTWPKAVFMLCAGRVRVKSAQPFDLTDGSLYGEKEVLGNEPVPYTLVALVTTYVILLQCEDLRYLFKECPHHPLFAQGVSSSLSIDKIFTSRL